MGRALKLEGSPRRGNPSLRCFTAVRWAAWAGTGFR